MKRPIALDLFCGAGGAGMGLERAGFDVVGVDFKLQPRYPFRFVQADVRSMVDWSFHAYDFIWASPPCQKHTSLNQMHNSKEHIDLIPETRALLKASGLPYCIENVVGAPLQSPIILCGTMFGLGAGEADLHRHRLFEASFPVAQPKCEHRPGRDVIGVYGGHVRNRRRFMGHKDRGSSDFSIADAQAAMGIDWMTLGEMSQAIPPAFSEFIGRAAMKIIRPGEG
jgi:DNA (cytosine-5)-methyltransferase 1